MVFKGAGSRDTRALAEAIEDVGGSLNAWTARDQTVFHWRALGRDLTLVTELIAELVRAPHFDEAHLEREKQVILSELGEVVDSPDDLVHEIFTGAFWPEHPLGRPILGQPATVSALDRDTLRAYFSDAYVAENFVVAAVGNIEHDRVRDLVARAEL